MCEKSFGNWQIQKRERKRLILCLCSFIKLYKKNSPVNITIPRNFESVESNNMFTVKILTGYFLSSHLLN